MRRTVSRRTFIMGGMITTGLSVGYSSHGTEQRRHHTDDFLSPWSPPKNQKRDLTPGQTPFRMCAKTPRYMVSDPTKENVADVIKRVKDAGYSATCSTWGPQTKNPWLTASESEIRELKETLAAYDVTYSDVHAHRNNIHPDKNIRESNWRNVAEQCEAAERVGCPLVTTHIGSRSDVSAVTIHPDNWTMETWKLAVHAIREILRYTSGMKVSLAVEALNLTPLNNPRAHKRLREDVGDPRCQVCYDPVNMLAPDSYYRTTELIGESFDLLGEDIIICHAKDALILPDVMLMNMAETVPGRGILDYETYLARMSRMKYPRTLLFENIEIDQYPEAKTFIEKTAEKVGVKVYH